VKSAAASVVLVGLALTVGGTIGAFAALSAARRAGGARLANSLRPIASLQTRGNDIDEWIDRGLLDLAEHELEPRRGTDAGNEELKSDDDEEPSTLTEQRDRLYRVLSYELGVPEGPLAQIRAIADSSSYFSQGNPDVTRHPMTREQCRARRAASPVVHDDERICGAPNMVALYDPEHEEPTQARLCIDQFEFPNIPCEYPVVWVRASEASRICRLLGKRLCDAHEWEGACAGKLRPAAQEYESFLPRLEAEYYHNRARERVWATATRPDGRLCATGAQKSPGCVDPSWERCGSNTYPAGSFPRCVSPFGVYDQHGNVAEHMNLPLQESQLGVRGGSGETEMKGSWFAFDEYHPHPDDCRWRAPAWHATPIDSATSHFNYHLGFRCCRDLN
jgi:sulfatase modifying factor 1